MTLRVPTFVVVSGGALGAFYARQLLRASAAGRLATERILVVDRDPACAAARCSEEDPRARLEVADWSDWLDAHLGGLGRDDHLVPYHWAPHLLVGWLERQAQRAGAPVARGGVIPSRGVPYERATREGDAALSYATWACPPTCIEPALCPHTRGPKDWSLAARLETPLPGDPFDDRLVFRCLHLVYGVGTIPVADVLAARDRLLAGLGEVRRYLVATSSHCHALATCLEVAPRAPSADPRGERAWVGGDGRQELPARAGDVRGHVEAFRVERRERPAVRLLPEGVEGGPQAPACDLVE